MVCAVISNRPASSAAITIARASRPVGANGFSMRIGFLAFTASRQISGESDGGVTTTTASTIGSAIKAR